MQNASPRQASLLFSRPEDHARLFFQFRRKIFDAAKFHARRHAMLHASGFEPLFGQVGAKNAYFSWEGEIGEICAAVRQLLFDLEYFYTAHSGLVFVFLCAGNFTAVTACAIFIIDQ
jgi:hypothetical protein